MSGRWDTAPRIARGAAAAAAGNASSAAVSGAFSAAVASAARAAACAAAVWALLALTAPTALAAPADSAAYRPAQAAAKDRTEPLPPDLAEVGVTEKLENQVPLDAVFADEDGRPARLGDFFRSGKPVILNLGYYACPMLCGLVANGLVNGLKELAWSPGQDFTIVTVSIDPSETPALARLKKQNYMRALGRPVAAAGWHFLTGREPEIKALTGAVGFGYRWDEQNRQFAHAAVLVVLTPEGRVSRYLYGIEFDPRSLRLSLLEASEGKVGSPFDRILMYCFHYDASEKRYALAATRLMRAGGVVTVLAVTGALALLWRREKLGQKRRRGEP